jgi:hypothetical protein
MQWYYSAAGAALGPHSADDIEDLFATGEVSADTLVWRKGLAEWTPLGDTDEFAQLADAGLPPPLPPSQRKATSYDADDDVLVADRLADDRLAGRHDDDTRVTTSPFTAATVAPVLAGPWTRYFARSIDMIIIISALSVGVYAVLPAVSPRYFSSIHLANPIAILIWLLPLAFLTNAIIITLFGNSLGKALFAIRAEPNDPDRHFGWGGNIVREFRVWFQGMALYIPLLSFFTMIPAFRRVLRGAPTTYDLGRVSVRAYSQSRLRRTLGMLFALLLYVGVTALGALDRSGPLSGSPTRSDTGLPAQPALTAPSSGNEAARPTSWTNPTTQLTATIPAGWQYELATGDDGEPLHTFLNETTQRAAFLGLETADNMDMATYTAALAEGLRRTMTLSDWTLSNLPGVWTASGQFLSSGSRATVYAVQTGTQFWRIVYIDQLATTPGQIAEPELTTALFRSVGIEG